MKKYSIWEKAYVVTMGACLLTIIMLAFKVLSTPYVTAATLEKETQVVAPDEQIQVIPGVYSMVIASENGARVSGFTTEQLLPGDQIRVKVFRNSGGDGGTQVSYWAQKIPE